MSRWSLLLLACLPWWAACPDGGDDIPYGDDDGTPSDDDDSAGSITLSMTLAGNPSNPFSALVGVVADGEVSAVVEYGETGSFDLATPACTVQPGQTAEVLVLGLRAGREHQLRVAATDGVDTWTTTAQTFTTDPLPGDWNDCWVDFGVDESEFDAQEALCTYMITGGFDRLQYCVDRWGEPVFSLRHPDNLGIFLLRALRSGEWAALSETESMLMLFDQRGELVAQWPPVFFEGLTRFHHAQIDVHDVIELTEGPWEGDLAMLTLCSDDLGYGPVWAGGLIVFDTESEQVVWDWCAHGAPGDGVPIDPLLDYDRETLLPDPNHQFMVNALLHGLDPDGSQFFWLSSNDQNWIFKIHVDSDAVQWRLGYGGDFALVEDLEDPLSPELPAAEWFYQPCLSG